MKLWRGLRALTLPALGLDGKKWGYPASRLEWGWALS